MPPKWWSQMHCDQFRDTCCHLVNMIEDIDEILWAKWCRLLPNYFGPCECLWSKVFGFLQDVLIYQLLFCILWPVSLNFWQSFLKYFLLNFLTLRKLGIAYSFLTFRFALWWHRTVISNVGMFSSASTCLKSVMCCVSNVPVTSLTFIDFAAVLRNRTKVGRWFCISCWLCICPFVFLLWLSDSITQSSVIFHRR